MPISTKMANDGRDEERFEESYVDSNAASIHPEGLEVISTDKLKSDKKSCKDVFNAFLVSLAYYAGIFEFPVIQPTSWVPNRLIPFSKAISCKDYDQWVHFYEFDYLFERVWRNPKRYLEILKRFNGVILPDFSVYRDMPFVMQLWNIYRSRALGF